MRLENGDVKTAAGYKEAYSTFAANGWMSLGGNPDYDGQGMPKMLTNMFDEMVNAASPAFCLYSSLTSGAAFCINAHASDALKSTYLSKMYSGEWAGAMALTESHAGTDLGLIRSKAVPQDDGSYLLTGQKIFITGGDHDLADNIIHLVLAKLPDAPAGPKGISLFLCPKVKVNADGSLGERNSFSCGSLEEKMGIHASSTCVMNYDGAEAFLVGELNQGLNAMFTMMNEARLFVGVQGVAIGERAYQAALQYAHDRVQGTPPGADKGAPIVHHPDVRRMLIDMKSRLMGARALAMATASADDLGDHARAELLTPITKSYGSDLGVDVASIGVQVHGGMGYVEETGAAQHLRDSRIAPIYEGTNGIQAIDLVGRKLRRDGGEAMRALISDLKEIKTLAAVSSGKGEADIQVCVLALNTGIDTLTTAMDIMLNAAETDALSVATPFLNLCGDIISGALLIKAVANGLQANDPHARNMASLARYHALSVMPRAKSQLDFIRAGANSVFDFPVGQLADL